MIEIEQLAPKENAQTSAIVLEVRQIPIIAQEESKKIDGKHEVKYVNQVPPLPGILVNATIGEPIKSKLIPLAPRSETKSLQFKMDANWIAIVQYIYATQEILDGLRLSMQWIGQV